MPEFPLDSELAAVGKALGGLTPRPPALDRDRLLYEAGRSAGSVSDRRIWQVFAGLFAAVSAGLGVRLATVPPRVEFVYVSPSHPAREGEAPAEPAGSLARQEPRPPASPGDEPTLIGYLRLRDQVVRFGTDVLQSGSAGAAAPEPPLESLLGLPAGTLSDFQKSRWQHQLFRGDV
jgi:hypothetical protein